MSLTPRQKHIASLIVSGLGNKQIAAVTGLSLSTVQNHIVQAAERIDIEGQHSPRLKLTIWFLRQDDIAA